MNKQEQALADFLKDNPRAQKYQFIIDKRLRNCNNPMSRLILINEMMLDSAFKLADAINNGIATECAILKLKEIHKPEAM